MNKGNGIAPEQAIELLFTITSRLSGLVLWTLIWCLHLTIAAALLCLLWTAGVTWGDVYACATWLLQTRPVEALTAAGLTAAALVKAYAALVHWAHYTTHKGRLFDYLFDLR